MTNVQIGWGDDEIEKKLDELNRKLDTLLASQPKPEKQTRDSILGNIVGAVTEAAKAKAENKPGEMSAKFEPNVSTEQREKCERARAIFDASFSAGKTLGKMLHSVITRQECKEIAEAGALVVKLDALKETFVKMANYVEAANIREAAEYIRKDIERRKKALGDSQTKLSSSIERIEAKEGGK